MNDADAVGGPLGMVGAVLVGGRSRRMGRDKALIEVDGVAMARRVASALEHAGCSRVLAVGPATSTAGLHQLPDLFPGEGPLGGIITALSAEDGSYVLAVACDLPWLDGASLAVLADVGRARPEVDVVAAFTDRLEPLCALWHPRALTVLSERFAAGERAVHRALASLTVVEVELSAAALHNVNTPDDLRSEYPAQTWQ